MDRYMDKVNEKKGKRIYKSRAKSSDTKVLKLFQKDLQPWEPQIFFAQKEVYGIGLSAKCLFCM